ncbi:MAG: TolC family protein [Lentimicrobiaceae bacterium]|nr:TolC family protein [Lentimicrobiaceae bacterium]
MIPLQKKCIQTGINHLHLPGIIYVVLSLFIGIHGSVGQPFLSLDDAMKTGLENNFGIRIMRNEATIATNNDTPGNAGFLPEISISGGYETSVKHSDIKVISGMELDENAASSNWVDAGVFLNWTLFDGMNMFVNRDRLVTLEQMGELEVRITMEKILSRIIIVYHDIVRNQMMENVLREQVELSRERTQIAETRSSIGAASELEYLRAQVDLNADESALIQQQAFTENARIALNELLAMDISLTFQVEDTILLQENLDIQALNVTCLAQNTEIQQEKYKSELDRLDLKSYEGARYPVLSLYSGYNFMENETEASFIEYNRQLGPYVGLSLQFTLFDGMNRHREVQNARIQIENAELSQQELELAVLSRLGQHFNQYKSELSVIDLENHNLSLAEKNMDIAGESYRIGSLSSIDLREIQENLLEAHSRLITALFRVKVQETELLRLSGNLLP